MHFGLCNTNSCTSEASIPHCMSNWFHPPTLVETQNHMSQNHMSQNHPLFPAPAPERNKIPKNTPKNNTQNHAVTNTDSNRPYQPNQNPFIYPSKVQPTNIIHSGGPSYISHFTKKQKAQREEQQPPRSPCQRTRHVPVSPPHYY